MKTLLINSSFGFGSSANANLASDLSESVAASGQSIEVLCAAVSLCTRPIVGVTVIKMPERFQCKTWSLTKLNFLLFAIAFLLVSGRKYHRIICMDDPQGLPIVLHYLRRLHWITCRIFLWQLDLAFVQRKTFYEKKFGKRLSAVLFSQLLESLNRVDSIVVMGKCMQTLLESLGVDSNLIVVIPPWPSISVSNNVFRTVPSSVFRILYSGHLGEWHDIEAIQQLLLKCRSINCHFTFQAVGQGIAQLRSFSATNDLNNISFQELAPHNSVGRALQESDAHLVSLRSSCLGTSVPSKTYAAMASSRPIIFLGPNACQAAIDIATADAGIVGDSNDLARVVVLLMDWIEDRTIAYRKGQAGYTWFAANRSMRVATLKWVALLNQA